MQQYEKEFLKFHILALVRDVMLFTMCLIALMSPIHVISAGNRAFSFFELLMDTYLAFSNFAKLNFLSVNWLALIATLLLLISTFVAAARIIRGIAAFIDWDMYVIDTYDKVFDDPRGAFAGNFLLTTLLFFSLLSVIISVFLSTMYVYGEMISFILHLFVVLVTNTMMHRVARSVKLQVIYDRFCK